MWIIIGVPIAAAAANQVMKVLLAVGKRRSPWAQLASYGGMPSMHTAVTVSLCAIIFLVEGATAAFGASVVFTAVVILDALMLRRYVGTHGAVLNRLIRRLPDDQEYRYPIMAVQVGHTFSQVLGGALVGLATALLASVLFL